MHYYLGVRDGAAHINKTSPRLLAPLSRGRGDGGEVNLNRQSIQSNLAAAGAGQIAAGFYQTHEFAAITVFILAFCVLGDIKNIVIG